jgi:hypothetical protein
MMATFFFDITQRVKVDIDEAKFTPELMDEFNRSISDYGHGEEALLQHAEHIGWLSVVKLIDIVPRSFVEGYGYCEEAGISATVQDDYFQQERVFPQVGA